MSGWRIVSGRLYAHVSMKSGREYDTVYRVQDENFMIFGDVLTGDRLKAKRAVVKVYKSYLSGRIIQGQPQSYSWGSLGGIV